MSKKEKKVRVNVRCNDVVKRYTMSHIGKFTNMKIGEVYDRLVEGKGIITKEDEVILKKSKNLRNLLRKLDFPKNKNIGLHEFLSDKREKIRMELNKFIEILEFGSQPVYFTDIVQKLHYDQYREIGAVAERPIVDLAMKEKLRKEILKGYEDVHFFLAYNTYRSKVRKFFKKYEDKENNRKPKNRINYHQDVYKNSNFSNWSNEDIIKTIEDCILKIYNYDNIIKFHAYNLDFNDYHCHLSRGMKYTFKESLLPQDGVYNTMVRNVTSFNSQDFRCKVEYIAYIPSFTAQNYQHINNLLDLDIKILSDYIITEKDKAFHECKKNDPLSFSEQLKNRFNKILREFTTPSLESLNLPIKRKSEELNKKDTIFKKTLYHLAGEKGYCYIHIGLLLLCVTYKKEINAIGIDHDNFHKYIPVDYARPAQVHIDKLKKIALASNPDYIIKGYHYYVKKIKDYAIEKYNFPIVLNNPNLLQLKVIKYHFKSISIPLTLKQLFYLHKFLKWHLDQINPKAKKSKNLKKIIFDNPPDMLSLKEYDPKMFFYFVYFISKRVYTYKKVLKKTPQFVRLNGKDMLTIFDIKVKFPHDLLEYVLQNGHKIRIIEHINL